MILGFFVLLQMGGSYGYLYPGEVTFVMFTIVILKLPLNLKISHIKEFGPSWVLDPRLILAIYDKGKSRGVILWFHAFKLSRCTGSCFKIFSIM